MMCVNGETKKNPDGTVYYICSKGEYANQQCPYVEICYKIGKYVMIDVVDCKEFLPKL